MKKTRCIEEAQAIALRRVRKGRRGPAQSQDQEALAAPAPTGGRRRRRPRLEAASASPFRARMRRLWKKSAAAAALLRPASEAHHEGDPVDDQGKEAAAAAAGGGGGAAAARGRRPLRLVEEAALLRPASAAHHEGGPVDDQGKDRGRKRLRLVSRLVEAAAPLRPASAAHHEGGPVDDQGKEAAAAPLRKSKRARWTEAQLEDSANAASAVRRWVKTLHRHERGQTRTTADKQTQCLSCGALSPRASIRLYQRLCPRIPLSQKTDPGEAERERVWRSTVISSVMRQGGPRNSDQSVASLLPWLRAAGAVRMSRQIDR